MARLQPQRRTRSRPRGRRRSGGRRRLALGLLPLLVLGAVGGLGARGMQERALEEGYGWIDPASLAPGELPAWADPRWATELEETLGALPPFRADDPAGRASVRAAIEELSFVAAVGPPRVVWPDRLDLRITLHEPVACVPVGERFVSVAADGTLLAGVWPLPPRLGETWLPVLGPMEDAQGIFRWAVAGDYLALDEHVVALDTVLSMRERLDEHERARLGRVVVDASRAALASVDEPGIRIDLEGRRAILFGRDPLTPEPGELPVHLKWDGVRRALDWIDDPRGDWDLVDVRWDRPELALRNPAPLVASVAPRTGPRSERARPAALAAPLRTSATRVR